MKLQTKEDPAFTGWCERVDELSRKHTGLAGAEFEHDFRAMYEAGCTPEGFVLAQMEDHDLDDIALNHWSGKGGLKELAT
jgi:hypothetical protein